MSSIKIEYEQKGIFFECGSCPDYCRRYGEKEGAYCHYEPESEKKIEGINPFSDIPDWCPRFPL